MLDPVKTVLYALGAAFVAGGAWVTQKHRVDRVRHDLNAMGRERVARLEKAVIELSALVEREREEARRAREEAIRRDGRFREWLAGRMGRIEQQLHIPPVGEPS